LTRQPLPVKIPFALVFTAAIQKLDPTERDAIRALVDAWKRPIPAHPYGAADFAAHLEIEAMWDSDSLAKLLRALLAAAESAANGTRPLDLEEACTPFQLNGPLLRGKRPTILGRVWTRRSYFKKVVDELANAGFPYTPDELEAFIRCPRPKDDAAAAIDRAIRQAPLGRQPLWSTFSHPDRETDPYSDSNPALTREEVYGRWSLHHYHREPDPLVLFTFKGNGLELHIPTVADGATFEYFTPAAAGDEHGWTKQRGDGRPGQPEVVSVVVLGDALINTRFLHA
jgi:hypothetical protein